MKTDKDLAIEQMGNMIKSCFAYGGIGMGTYNFRRYIEPFRNQLGDELFESTYEQQSAVLKNCSVKVGVYTDHEGCCYNEIIYKQQ